jgi:Protein of unknown function (DUF2778)
MAETEEWVYEQETGNLFLNNAVLGKGYSGAPDHVNKSSDEKLVSKGPIPAGLWHVAMKFPRHTLGMNVVQLKPDVRTNTFGRSEFFIHGDRDSGRPQSASNGCIVLPDNALRKVFNSSIHTIRVVRRLGAGILPGGGPKISITDRARELGLAGNALEKSTANKDELAAMAKTVQVSGPKCGSMPISNDKDDTKQRLALKLSKEYKDVCIYSSSTGHLFLGGELIAVGYSGAEDCLNKTSQEREKNKGPIPTGNWKVHGAQMHPALGKSLQLVPDGHSAHGRTEFFIHATADNKSLRASKGCIILTNRAVDWLAGALRNAKLMVVG